MAFNVLVLSPTMADVWFAGQPTGVGTVKTAKEWCIDQGADLCFNLAEFNMANGLSCCEVVAQGRRISYGYGSYSDMLYINEKNYCHGYSNGIKDNVVKLNHAKGGSRTRNGIGITTSGYVILAQSSHKCTEKVFCESVLTFVKNKGHRVKLFLLQDGGGSTTGYSSRSKLIFNPEPDNVKKPDVQRKVATIVCVKFKNLPVMTRPIYKNCSGTDVGILQMVLGGIEVDDSAGKLTKQRITQAQAALGMVADLQCGIASALTYKKLGLTYNI